MKTKSDKSSSASYFIIGIVIIILVVCIAQNPGINVAIIMPAALLLMYILGKCSEAPAGDNPTEAFTPNFGVSAYGNIDLANDVDTSYQKVTPPKLKMPADKVDDFDNADVVSAVLAGGNTYQPMGDAITPTSSATMSAMTLGGGGYDDNRTFIQSMGATDFDESAAQRQQHRGNINRRAIEGRVRSTKNIYERSFRNELNENENRVWWEGDAADGLEDDFWANDINL